MKILVTGGAGFIGCNFVRYMVQNYDHEITVLDNLTYAGNLENLADVSEKIEFIKGDICSEEDVSRAMKDVDSIIHFAAESHVDNSIKNPENFVKTNIFGTYTLLEYARKFGIDKFLHVSTDEVYGSTETGFFKEEDRVDPSSPYSATKAGSDLLVNAYHRTYGLNTFITHCGNNFGPYQYPEKLIPVLIKKALKNEKLPIYGDGLNVRDWIYVEDHCTGIDMVFNKGNYGEVYNIGSGYEKTNLEIVKFILNELDKPESLIEFVKDRPGHDRRYALDSTKMRSLGWAPKWEFEKALKYTINWYLDRF
ncbi:dTDP-glucose 4,6-dehydratase [Methanococcus maripaludis]|jgi:dTDP-glucose 4,6-dehydratase|uniref:dTDP-glucose 4,6-dehydratase n=1 Tax=Methanococcus maripaludis X1 TaxID=1053692 RepID=G0H2R1_METMI|nr:dTDP-glucose 4,6-dehydratase [Methanococcus maripaludis]AEK19260.1 dTDP-glucose 4,6-dehydratase [Methanococcus maripaludis X1]